MSSQVVTYRVADATTVHLEIEPAVVANTAGEGNFEVTLTWSRREESAQRGFRHREDTGAAML
jgi:hypothetical protein